MDFRLLDARPVIVTIAGPNGAGKTTFYYQLVAVFEQGRLRTLNEPIPAWLKPLLP